MSTHFYDPLAFFCDSDELPHLNVIHRNNPLCLVYRQLVLDNNRRGPMPNNNPTEMDDFVARLAALTDDMKRSCKFKTWGAPEPVPFHVINL